MTINENKTDKRLKSEQAILEAAKHLFAAKGFDATTSKEIAREAKLAEGLIFRYFVDKKGLLQELMQKWFDKNLYELSILEEDSTDLKNGLNILLSWIFNSYYNNLELNQIAIATRLNTNYHIQLETICEKFISKRREMIINRLASLQQNGKIKLSTDLRHLYEVIQSYAMTEALFLKINPEQYSKAVNGFVEILINGI